MNGNVCREVQREIDQSELRQSLSAAGEAHISACAACATFRDERLRLRELVGGLQPVSAPADFEIRLRARIARERDLPRQPFVFRLVMSTPAIVVAAVLVIAVGAVVFMSQKGSPQNPAETLVNNDERVNPAPAPTASTTVAQDQKKEPMGVESTTNSDSNKSKPGAQIVRNSPKPSQPANSFPQVNEFSAGAAQRITAKQSDRAGEVSLVAPNRPMVVTMYDENGAARKIQLPPISFGSQRLTDSRKQVSMTNTKDW